MYINSLQFIFSPFSAIRESIVALACFLAMVVTSWSLLRTREFFLQGPKLSPLESATRGFINTMLGEFNLLHYCSGRHKTFIVGSMYVTKHFRSFYYKDYTLVLFYIFIRSCYNYILFVVSIRALF